jgi:FkbM family methyltransferase
MRTNVFDCVKKRILDFFGIYLRRNSLPRGVLLKSDVFKLYKGESLNLIWDVGAHRGETALNFRNAFPNAIIHSFEPIKENFRVLSKLSPSLSLHHPHQLALGPQPDTVKMCIRQASVLNSLNPALNKPEPDDRGEEEVKVDTVDRLLARWNIEHLDLLKLDVEGYESQVIEGCQSSLEAGKISFIYLETGLDDRFVPLEVLVEQLAPFSIHPYAFYEQSAHWTGNQRLWYWNALFAKEDLL